jgi:hypothetical protein
MDGGESVTEKTVYRDLADPECKLPIPKGLHIALLVSPEYPSDHVWSLEEIADLAK